MFHQLLCIIALSIASVSCITTPLKTLLMLFGGVSLRLALKGEKWMEQSGNQSEDAIHAIRGIQSNQTQGY